MSRLMSQRKSQALDADSTMPREATIEADTTASWSKERLSVHKIGVPKKIVVEVWEFRLEPFQQCFCSGNRPASINRPKVIDWHDIIKDGQSQTLLRIEAVLRLGQLRSGRALNNFS